jgi:hypothetical protein
MKNCRRKLKRVVRGSLFSDAEFNDRLDRIAGGKLTPRAPGGRLPDVPGKSYDSFGDTMSDEDDLKGLATTSALMMTTTSASKSSCGPSRGSWQMSRIGLNTFATRRTGNTLGTTRRATSLPMSGSVLSTEDRSMGVVAVLVGVLAVVVAAGIALVAVLVAA